MFKRSGEHSCTTSLQNLGMLIPCRQTARFITNFVGYINQNVLSRHGMRSSYEIDMYSGHSGFESRVGHRLSRLRSLANCLSPSRYSLGQYPFQATTASFQILSSSSSINNIVFDAIPMTALLNSIKNSVSPLPCLKNEISESLVGRYISPNFHFIL
jgi:hypothetical protein